jgi:hypothetical protein
MPHENAYNEGIAQKARSLSRNDAQREKDISDFSTNYEIPSQLESAVLHAPEVNGGSGYAAATVADLGFEPTLGATGTGKPKRTRNIEVGEGLSAAGVSAAGVSAGGVSAGKRVRKGKGVSAGGEPIGGALLSLRDLDKMHGQPPDSIKAKVTMKAEGREIGSGVSGGGGSKRNEIVKEVTKKHGLSLPAASKHVKERKLD